MSEDALYRRMIGNFAGVSLRRTRRGQLSQHELQALSNANARVSRSNLRFLDVSRGAKTVSTVVAGVRREVRKHGIKLVIVDYLQKLKPSEKNEKRTYEVGDVSEKLHACASSTKTAVVCLAQLSRESEKDKGRMPKLSDLSDSSQIEKDADLVLLLHRDRAETRGEGSLIIAKQRDGECGLIQLFYDGQFCRFTELESKPDEID
jgi:replicative DNA helicase